MKKILIALMILSLTACCFTGCSDDRKSSSKENKTTTSATTTSQSSITSEPTITTDLPDTPEFIDPKNSKTIDLDKVNELFPEFDEKTGFISSSSDKLESIFQNPGNLDIKELDNKTISSGTLDDTDSSALFKVHLTNTRLPELISDAYIYNYNIPDDENIYLITLGLSPITEKEIEPYCFTDTEITYYTLIKSSNNNTYVVMPIIGGNDEIGYWLIKPMLEAMKIDVSSMKNLNLKNTQTPNSPAADDDLFLRTTNVSYDSDSTHVEYELTNNIGISIYLDDVVVTLNNKDITDETIIFLESEKEKTTSGSFNVPEKIVVGDKLIISGTVIDNDSYEEIGSIEFPLVFE